MAFASAGCIVDAVCPPRHPLTKTRALGVVHTYRGLSPLKSYARAIALTKPDLIVPCDDLATAHLHDIYRDALALGKEGKPVCELIQRSLGSPANFPVVFSRTAFITFAQEEGVRVPKTEVISNIEELRGWVSRIGFPFVLKANGTSGGDGVRVVRTLDEAERALGTLQAPPLLARAVKRAVVDRDMTLVWQSISRHRYTVNAQSFVPGRDATSLIASWNGNVLASLHFEVLNKRNSAGPACVVRMIENADMLAAVTKMAKRLNLSGLHGFDFLLESDSEHAFLIEINPRSTQIGHLTLGSGRDLPAALVAAVSGKAIREAPMVTEKGTIALFPQEWKRDPQSPFLKSSYHDVPWDEPELVRACVRGRQNLTALYSRREQIRTLSAARLPSL
jgi:Carbamoyl-phosphate synthase L chain, ATP binding domain